MENVSVNSLSEPINEHLITEANEEEEEIELESSLRDRSKLCYVCDSNQIDLFFNCGNGLCSECIEEHTKSQLAKYKVKVLSDKIQFVCAGSCKCPVDSEIIEKSMDKNTKEMYNEVLLKMYLSKTEDVLSCPRSSCPNYGFASRKTTFGINILNYSNCYECDECKYKWSESKDSLKELLFAPRLLFQRLSLPNIKSIVKKYIITKYCNKCSAPIEKAEGCKHIECNRCDYSFCWRCTEDWSTHTELACMGLLSNIYEESLRPDFPIILFVYLFILLVLKFIFSFSIVIEFVLFLLKVATIVGILALDSLLIKGTYLAIYRKLNKQRNFCILTIAWIILKCLLYYYELHPISLRLCLCSELCFFSIYSFKLMIKGA